MEDGTGIVHIAPAFGEVDYEAGRRMELDFVQQVDLQGKITGNYPFAGKFVKEADPLISGRPESARAALPQRDHPPYLSLLLALRYAAALLRQADLVYQDHRRQRHADLRQRGDQLVSGAYQVRALRRLAGE